MSRVGGMHYGIPTPVLGAFAEEHLELAQFRVKLPRVANDFL